MNFAYPVAVVGICAVVSRAVEAGHDVELTKPESTDTANYLSRVRLPAFLEELGVSHELPSVRERDVGDNLLELRKFGSEDEVGEFGKHLHGAVAASSTETANALYQAAMETGANVMDHSRHTFGFVMAQRTHNRKIVNFAVGDAGIGVFRSLEHLGVASEEDALAKAMKGGVSATGLRGRGNGLRSLTDGVVSLGGWMSLASGANQRTESAHDASQGKPVLKTRYPTSLQGTLISGAIPITS
jgi:hypothetical protein